MIVFLVIVFVVSTAGVVALHQSDAQHYYRVAVDPFGNGSVFANAPPGSGIAYRYGRIGFPLLAWLLALGQPAGIAVTLPLVYLAGIWLLVTLASEACARAGRPAAGLLVLLLPYAWCMGPVMVPEFLVAGLILFVYRSVEREHWRVAYFIAAALLLVRETAVLALVPLVWSALSQKTL